MKKIKNLLFLVLTIIASCVFCISGKNNNANIASAEFSVSDAKFGDAVFSYLSISQAGQEIKPEHLQTITENDKEITYVITNNSVTLTFINPIANALEITENTRLDNFFENKTKIVLEKDAETGIIPDEFIFNDVTYYFSISGNPGSETLYIYASATKNTYIIASSETDLINYTKTEDQIEIYITTSFTSKETGFKNLDGTDSKNCSFEFATQTRAGQISYVVNIQKPIINFYNLTEPVVMFDTFTSDDLGNPYPAEKSIAANQVFNKLKVSFLSNEYTEGNPLYFNINFNGFEYNYKLYSKIYNGENLLFINYTDEYTSDEKDEEDISYNNSQNLATKFKIKDGEIQIDQSGNPIFNRKIYAENIADSSINQFSLIFENTGRYEIEIYDSTYDDNDDNGNTGMPQSNYYKTSFFIRDTSEDVSPFKNIYIVAQTITDSGELDDYIVDNSTLNQSVNISIKNLGGFGKDASGNNIQLADVIESIVIRSTDFGIDTVKTVETIYTVDQILASENFVNNDFVLMFQEDAYYQVIINPKQPTEPGAEKLKAIEYFFTIVKKAKTTFRYNGVPYEAQVAFKTIIEDFTNPISPKDKMTLNFQFSNDEVESLTLDKTFINRFEIRFGVKSVSVKTFEPVPANENEKVPDGLYVQVFGVGDITVYLTTNGQTEVFVLNSEKGNNYISREGYGVYTIKIVDSMGTESQEYVFEIKKGLNTSALILVVLSSIIISVIVIFVMKARGRVATR